MNGVLHDGGLVRYLVQLGTEREILLDRGGQFFEVFAEGEDVAARLHGDGDADGGRTVVEHTRLGWVNRLALDACDVAETKDFPVCRNRERTDVLDVFKHARGTQLYGVALRLDAAARRHCILRGECVRDGGRGDAELCEPFEGDLDVDALALHADQLDLLHARNGEDAAACVLRHAAQLLIAVVRACNGVDRAVHVVEAVVVERPVDPCGQVALYVLAEVPHVAPRRANLRRIHIVAQLDVDRGLSRACLTVDLFQPRGVLKTPFEFVRDLLLHFLRACPRPCGGDHHLADGKGGILHASECIVGKDAADGKDDDEVPDECAVAQGELCEVSHFVRTFSPSWSWCTPAVTMRAPCGSPVTRASLVRNAVTVTGTRCTASSSTT